MKFTFTHRNSIALSYPMKIVQAFTADNKISKGFMWVTISRTATRKPKHDIISIEACKTNPSYLRRGVMTAILDEVLRKYKPDLVMTLSGTKSGRPWLLANGFAWNKKLMRWERKV